MLLQLAALSNLQNNFVAWQVAGETCSYYLAFKQLCFLFRRLASFWYREIHADVIVYIFAHLHTALRTEGHMLDMN